MKKYSREWNEKIWNTLEKKTATDIFEELLIALASWDTSVAFAVATLLSI